MINIYDKRKCSGCKACSNACPVNAISFEYDNEGILYPAVDKTICVDCGKCDRVCPYNNDSHGVPFENFKETPLFFAAQLKDKERLDYVSSGGAFQAFAEAVIKEGGVVYGVTQEDVDHIFHIRVGTISELKYIRKSKYLQSDVGESYRQVKKDLLEGKTVLFSGTGCQIAGLNCYLGEKKANLYTCEVVCHGVPSRKVWEQYRKEKEQLAGKSISDIVFRDKSRGWSFNQYKITYDDGTSEYERSSWQLFHAGYLQGLFYRPSCGNCRFAVMPRVADVTLADFWKYNGSKIRKFEGVSLVAVNNNKGHKLLEKTESILELEKTTRQEALTSCRHLNEIPVENPNRKAFIECALSEGYFAAAKKYIQPRKHKGLLNAKSVIAAFYWRHLR